MELCDALHHIQHIIIVFHVVSEPVVLERVPPTSAPSSPTIIIVVVVIVLLLLVVVVVVVLVLYICYKNKAINKKGIYSPEHFNQQPNSGNLELKSSSPTIPENGHDPPFTTAALEKEAEATMELAPAITPTESEGAWCQ